MQRLTEIDCSEFWWLSAHSDPHNTAGKYDIDVSVLVDGVTYRMHSTPLETLTMLLDNWGSYALPVDVRRLTGGTPPDSVLASHFSDYLSRTQENLKRMILAYRSAYNPLENYNGEMTIVDTTDPANPYSKTKTISGQVQHNTDVASYGKSGAAIGQTADETAFNDFESKQYETTYDNTADPAGAKLRGRDTSSKTGSYVHSTGDAASNYTTWDNYQETETETGTRDHTETRHGNLGLTTSQDMVRYELELRKHDILRDYLQAYINQYFVIFDGGFL